MRLLAGYIRASGPDLDDASCLRIETPTGPPHLPCPSQGVCIVLYSKVHDTRTPRGQSTASVGLLEGPLLGVCVCVSGTWPARVVYARGLHIRGVYKYYMKHT